MQSSISSTSTNSTAASIARSFYALHTHAILMYTLQKWANFIPLTIPFVEATALPLLAPYLSYEKTHTHCYDILPSLELCVKSAFALLIAILEGSHLSEDQVLALSFGLSISNSSSNLSGTATLGN